jgi:DNA-directed RNA polymerase subunit RPC12/RpoP
MNDSLGSVINDAREQGHYICARCDYALSDVPLKDDLSVVCPECGYEMVFEVKVSLRPKDPNYDREARSWLSRLEMSIMVTVILLVALAVTIGLTAMVLIG